MVIPKQTASPARKQARLSRDNDTLEISLLFFAGFGQVICLGKRTNPASNKTRLSRDNDKLKMFF